MKVLHFQSLYLKFTAALFLGASLVCTLLLPRASTYAVEHDLPRAPLLTIVSLCALLLAFLSLVRVVTLRTPPSPFAWRINAILLGLDLSTLILWPFALPLLVQWLKKDTKAAFGVSRET